MLFRLFLFRLGPLVFLKFCKEKRQIKLVVCLIGAIYGLCLLLAIWRLFSQEKWLGIIYLPISMLPHYIAYGFAIWMLVRCIWSAWSGRVWNRIYIMSVISVIIGIFSEYYINPQILQIFFKIFK